MNLKRGHYWVVRQAAVRQMMSPDELLHGEGCRRRFVYMLQHVLSLSPAVAGIARVYVTYCSRSSHLAIAIPLHNDKIRVQKRITDYFRRAPVVVNRVRVQQKLTKYFNPKPKAGRLGAAAPRHHRRRHHASSSSPPTQLQCRTRSHHNHQFPTGCGPLSARQGALVSDRGHHPHHGWPRLRALHVSVPMGAYRRVYPPRGATAGLGPSDRAIVKTSIPSCSAEL